MDLTRMLTPYFRFVCYSHECRQYDTTSLKYNRTFITADLNRIKACWDSEHFTLDKTNVPVKPDSSVSCLFLVNSLHLYSLNSLIQRVSPSTFIFYETLGYTYPCGSLLLTHSRRNLIQRSYR